MQVENPIKNLNFIMTLREWQNTYKNIDTLIVQASVMNGSDSWQKYPIGLGYKYVLCDISDQKIQIGTHHKTVFCAITASTDNSRRQNNKINRKTILNNLDKNSIKNILLNEKEYFNSLPDYKFVISPEGNGIDCHRHYESLLAGSIPIIEHNSLIEDKYKGCPILYTTDYSEINENYLITKYNEMLDKTYDFSRLFLSYYSSEQIEEIKECGNFWTLHLAGKQWYN